MSNEPCFTLIDFQTAALKELLRVLAKPT